MQKAIELNYVGTGDDDSKTPLVLVPDRHRAAWRDDFAKKNAARARALKKAVGVLDCGPFTALVLGGDGEVGSTWLPLANGGVIVRWLDARPGPDDPVVRAASEVPADAWKAQGEIEIRDPKWAMFAALDSAGGAYGEDSRFGPLGDEDHPFGWLAIGLKPGTYTIDFVKEHTAHGVTLQLIRLRLEGSAAATIAAPPPAAPPRPAPAKPKKGELYDDYAARLLANAGLDPRTTKAISALRLPAILVTTTSAAPTGPGASRLGGDPDLAKGTAWPRHEGKPMSFVAQFRLADVARVAKVGLPKKGLLSFFVSEGEDAYLEKGAVLLFTEGTKLVAIPRPEDFRRFDDGKPVNKGYRARGVSFAAANKLPSPSNVVTKAIRWQDGEKAAYEDLYNATLTSERHQLMGYRDRSYDGEQKATSALLFQCFSDDRTDMEWGDDDHLYFYVAKAALAKADFSKVTASSGE